MAHKRSFFESIIESIGNKTIEAVSPDPGQRLKLSGTRMSIPLPVYPLQVELGKERLHIQKDIRCDGSTPPQPPDLIVFNPELAAAGIDFSLRVEPGESLRVSRDQPDLANLFGKPKKAFRRNFELEHAGDKLVLRDTNSEYGTFISLLETKIEQTQRVADRRNAIDKIIALYGGPLVTMPKDEALSALRQVNEVLTSEAFRPNDRSGFAGGLLQLPAHITPVVIGDLHANMDNLLKILSENAFMRVLEEGTGALVFLGDLVQPDSKPYDDMDDSVLIMDFLCKLKLRFPESVFFLRGNHDSFSEEVSKDLIPQAVLWRKKLAQVRGEDYCETMARFYELCPVVALSGDFFACHAGAPINKVNADKLINIRDFPELLHDLTWNRARRPGYPAGYTASDVRRFRKSLQVDKCLPFLVSHTPYSETGTVWRDVSGIEHHHVLYSARNTQLAVYIRVNGQMLPQVYAAEPLLEWTNNRARSLPT